MEPMDLRGKPCPIPVIEMKKLLAAAAHGETISVIVDNDIARQNLQKLAEGEGHDFTFAEVAENCIEVSLTVLGAEAKDGREDNKGFVVTIGCNRMGQGSDELGFTLMKSFIYSLTEMESPPEHLLFFNSGVHLTCDHSSALADLAILAEKGVAIQSCGACLSYYKKTDKLAIGAVTNMFAIAGIMAEARRLINL